MKHLQKVQATKTQPPKSDLWLNKENQSLKEFTKGEWKEISGGSGDGDIHYYKPKGSPEEDFEYILNILLELMNSNSIYGIKVSTIDNTRIILGYHIDQSPFEGEVDFSSLVIAVKNNPDHVLTYYKPSGSTYIEENKKYNSFLEAIAADGDVESAREMFNRFFEEVSASDFYVLD